MEVNHYRDLLSYCDGVKKIWTMAKRLTPMYQLIAYYLVNSKTESNSQNLVRENATFDNSFIFSKCFTISNWILWASDAKWLENIKEWKGNNFSISFWLFKSLVVYFVPTIDLLGYNNFYYHLNSHQKDSR